MAKMDFCAGMTWRPEKNSCKSTVKEGKGQPNANRVEDLSCPVKMDSNKSCNIDYSNAKAATESGDQSPMTSAQWQHEGTHCTSQCIQLS